MTSRARLIAAVISMFVSGAVLAEETPLSKLDLARMTCGWDKPKVDQSVTKTKLSINGQVYEKGVGTHANSYLWVDLDGKAERFTALVGVDDNCRSDKATLQFRVYGDGRKLFDSGVMHYKNAAQPVDVKLDGVKKVLLAVFDAGDGVEFDHADWVDAKFVYAGAAPLAATAPVEAAVILTPKDPPSPRINGARAWGCRPGNPFQFTIPASGLRPMTFAAENLPEGLKLDPATGTIRGTNPPKGEYVVTLIAKNAQGEDRKSLKIVSGDTLALTPHMGWNSWYVWENRVTDQHIRGAADAMVASGMMNHGYMYVNIDDCWGRKPKSKDPVVGAPDRDEKGNLITNQRFPDMTALTSYIHSKGLLAGIYTSPGPTTCAGHTGAWQHEEQDAKQFADWGFDFLKYDWCSYGGLVKGKTDLDTYKKPYKQMGDILKQQKRDMVLNLCQYGMGKVWDWGRDVGGHSWRTAGDLGLTNEGIVRAIYVDVFGLDGKDPQHGPGGWNDPDYLLLGYISGWNGTTRLTPLTPNEQYTHVTLWSMLSAPLIFSGDMQRLDDFTLNLLCNDEVLAVDQDLLGKQAKRVSTQGDIQVWAKTLADGTKAIAVFNTGEFESKGLIKASDVGLNGNVKLRDLWRQKDLGEMAGQYEVALPRHGCLMVRTQK